MSMQRQLTKRPVAVAGFVIVTLIFCIYSLSSHLDLPSTSSQGYPQPISVLHSSSVSSLTESPQTLAPPSEPSAEATLEPAPEPTPEPTPCGLTKMSMLYGAHQFPQLQGALESHRRHSHRWGCGFESLEQDVTSRKLYSKHYFLLSTMLQELSKPAEERKQWLMWVDADSILINPAISPTIFLPSDDLGDVFALVTADHQGLNNGIFYLKVGRSSLDLLTQIVDYPLAHPDDDLGWFGEQAAMENVIKATEAQLENEGKPPGIAWVPRQWFNTYQFEHGFEGEPGHFIVHFAGLAETRISHMASWLDELQFNQAKWEIPPEKSFYKTAIPDFWTEFAANATKET